MSEPFLDSDNDDSIMQDGTAEAVVQFGDVAPDENNALYEVDDTGIWTDYYVVNRYEDDKQIWMLPVTSPGGFEGDSVAFVQLAAATRLLVCDWTAEKTGEPPSIPMSEPADDNMVLLDKHVETGMKELEAGGTEDDIVYRISGTYVYGFKNPDQASTCFPQPPWMQSGAGECDVSDGLETEGIMCCQAGEGGEEGASAGDGGEQSTPETAGGGELAQN